MARGGHHSLAMVGLSLPGCAVFSAAVCVLRVSGVTNDYFSLKSLFCSGEEDLIILSSTHTLPRLN